MAEEEKQEKHALVEKYKIELKKEGLALILLDKLKKSQMTSNESPIIATNATATHVLGM